MNLPPATTEAAEPALLVVESDRQRLGAEPLGQMVTRHLRTAIIDGRIRAGARIRQEAVARELG